MYSFQFNHGPPNSRHRHAGDLGNIDVQPDGTAQFTLTDKMLSLVGGRSIIGRSIVIDQDPDDFTSNSDHGKRPALCGVIGRLEWKQKKKDETQISKNDFPLSISVVLNHQ